MTISVPASSANLGPGFDTLGLALDLRNKISIKEAKSFSIEIYGEGEDISAFRRNNLFINVFNKHFSKFETNKKKLKFSFYNNIPISRGLGSSSAAIIGAISAVYNFLNIKYTKNIILNSAINYEKHPDNITPALVGGFTVSILEHNKVYYKRKKMPSFLKAVIVIPNEAIRTNSSRTSLKKSFSREDCVYNMSRASFLTSILFSGNYEFLKLASKDKMHQKLRMNQMPELFEVQKIALNNGALMSTLSGSGSSFFNLSYEDDAKRLEKVLSEKFKHFRVLTLDFDNSGLIIE